MAVARGPSLMHTSIAIAAAVAADNIAREQREEDARRRREEDLAALRRPQPGEQSFQPGKHSS